MFCPRAVRLQTVRRVKIPQACVANNLGFFEEELKLEKHINASIKRSFSKTLYG